MESRHYILPLVRSTSLCTSSILDVYKSSGEGRSGPSRVSTVSAFFFGCGGHGSPSCFLLAGLPRRLPCHLVLFTQPLFLLSHLRIETLLLSLWLFSVFRVYSHVFMTEQQFSPQRPSETPLALLMIPFGNASLYGAHDSVIFLFCLFRSDCGFSCLFVRQSFVSFYYLLLQVCYCFLSFKKKKKNK